MEKSASFSAYQLFNITAKSSASNDIESLMLMSKSQLVTHIRGEHWLFALQRYGIYWYNATLQQDSM